MKSFLIVVSTFLFIQFCTCTTVEHAENKLRDLRGHLNKKLEEALSQHDKLSKELNELASTTKELGLEDIGKETRKFQAGLRADRSVTYKCRGSRSDTYERLKQIHSEDLVRCVDQQHRQGLSTLATERVALVAAASNAIYNEEKDIVFCGRNTNCLDSAIGSIKEKFYQVAKNIHEEVGKSRDNKHRQAQLIRGCARRSVANVAQALGNVPTCTF